MYDENPHRNFWAWVTFAMLFAGTYAGGGVTIGFDWSMVAWNLMPKPMAIGAGALYGAWMFKLSNEKEWPYALGLAAFAFPLAGYFMSIGIGLRNPFGVYFGPFVLLFSWLIAQWFYTTIPD